MKTVDDRHFTKEAADRAGECYIPQVSHMPDNLKTRLLQDIRRAFARCGDPDLMRTRDLLEELLKDQEAPWAEYGTTGLGPRHLGLLLKDFDIKAATLRFEGGRQAKGFARLRFTDAWARYCPEESASESSDESTPMNPGPHP